MDNQTCESNLHPIDRVRSSENPAYQQMMVPQWRFSLANFKGKDKCWYEQRVEGVKGLSGGGDGVWEMSVKDTVRIRLGGVLKGRGILFYLVITCWLFVSSNHSHLLETSDRESKSNLDLVTECEIM